MHYECVQEVLSIKKRKDTRDVDRKTEQRQSVPSCEGRMGSSDWIEVALGYLSAFRTLIGEVKSKISTRNWQVSKRRMTNKIHRNHTPREYSFPEAPSARSDLERSALLGSAGAATARSSAAAAPGARSQAPIPGVAQRVA